VALLLATCLLPAPGSGAGVVGMRLEELLELEVFSASRSTGTVQQTPSAVTVLTADDIARSASGSVAAALALAPGVESLHVSGHRRAVGIRGRNGILSNKLLVMQDGRSLYSPLFSGTWWEMPVLPAGDIDRIEIVRGPGATLWGSNAVNGIINILSKPADRTQGTLLETTVRTPLEGSLYARHGGRAGDAAHYRVSASWEYAAPGADLGTTYADGTNPPARDLVRSLQVNTRIDHAGTGTSAWMLEAGAFQTRFGETILIGSPLPPLFARTVSDEARAQGAHANFRWTGDGARLRQSLDAWTHASIYEHPLFFEERRITGNLDWQAHLAPRGRHAISLGAGARVTADWIDDTPVFWTGRESTVLRQLSAYVQDTITLEEDRWQLTAGAKLELGYYDTLELQPQLRLLHTPSSRTTWWASVARAARTPTRAEREGHVIVGSNPGPGFPVVFFSAPNRSFDSEHLVAIEAGVRSQVARDALVAASLFHHVYTGLRRPVADDPSDGFLLPWGLYVPVRLHNGGTTHTWGGELEASWNPAPWLRLAADVSLVQEPDPDSVELAEPRRTRLFTNVRSVILPADGWEVSLWLRHNRSHRTTIVADMPTEPWWNLNARVAWTPAPGWSLAVTGENLLEPTRYEGASEALRIVPTLVRRTIGLRVSRDF
jgi:iron complex outermembrane receptor protein